MRRTLLLPLVLVLGTGGPGVARAEITPAAQRIVDHWIEATGGREAFEADRAVHVRGRITSNGLDGRYELWRERPGRLAETVVLGSLRTRTGTDGIVAWDTDLSSRKVTELDGSDRERQLVEAWFENELWAAPDQGGGKVVTGSRTYGQDAMLEVLVVTPPVGEPRRLWFDAKTGHLMRITGQADQYHWMMRCSRHARRGGRIRPTLIESGDAKDEEWEAAYQKLQVDSVWVSDSLDDARFAPPGTKPRVIQWAGARDSLTLPFRYGSKHVWITVSVDGSEPMDFMLDTGASLSVLSTDVAGRLEIPREGKMLVEGMAGVGQVGFGKVQSLTVGDEKHGTVTLRDFRVALLDLDEGFEYVMWRRPAGILGGDFLSRFAVTIDYDRRLVTFRAPGTYQAPESAAALPMGLMSGVPTVELEVEDGCTGRFMVDVGSSFHLNVFGSMVRRCALLGTKRRELTIWGGGVAGAFSSTLCRLGRVRLGPHERREPIAALSLGTHGGIGSKDCAGNIGNGMLEHFRVTFDYPQKTLWLEPGARRDEPDSYSRIGAMFIKYGPRVLVVSITHNSPADDAGFRLLDEIETVDGKPIAGWTSEQLDRFEEGAVGKTHEIVVRRLFGEHETLRLELREVL